MSRFMSLYPSANRSKTENRPQLPSRRLYRPRFQGGFAPRTQRNPNPHTPLFGLGLPRPAPRAPVAAPGPQYLIGHAPQLYTPGYVVETYEETYEASYIDTSQEEYTDVSSSSTLGTVTGYEPHETEDQGFTQPETSGAEQTVYDYSHESGNGYQSQSTHEYHRTRGYGNGFPRVQRARALTHSYRGRGRGDYPTTYHHQQDEVWQEDSSYVDNTQTGYDISYGDNAQIGYDEHASPRTRGRGLPMQPRGVPPRGRNSYTYHPPNRGRGRGADNSSNQAFEPPDKGKSSLVHSVEEEMDAIVYPKLQEETTTEEILMTSTSTAAVVSTATTVSTSVSMAATVSTASSIVSTSRPTGTLSSKAVISQQSPHISSASSLVSQTSSSSSGISSSQSSLHLTNKAADLLVPTSSQPQSTSPNVSQTGTTSITSVSDTVTSSSSASKTLPDTTTVNTSKVKTMPENSQSKLISSFAQSLMNTAGSPNKGPEGTSPKITHYIPPNIEMPPFRPSSMTQMRRPPGPTLPPQGTSLHQPQHFQSPSSHSVHASPKRQDPQYTQSPIKQGTVDSTVLSQQKGDNQEEDEESEEEIDTGHCQYCNIDFSNPDSYWKHTRGILHTQKLMEAESKKKEEGEDFFKTETVDAGPRFVQRDEKGKRVLSKEERRQTLRDEIKLVAMLGEAGHTPDDNEYDFNRSNWMDMEGGTPKLKIAARDRDLNPNDVGKEQFPDEFYCEVCDVRCTGSVTFRMHVDGNKHKLKVDKGTKKGVNPTNVKIVACDKRAKILETFNQIYEPLVGLQYVTEFQKQDDKQPPKYVCNMCEAKCDTNSIISHCTGIKHRNHYFKEHYPETFQKMMAYTSRKKSEQNTFAEEFARDIESKEGRQSVKVKLEIDVSTELVAADLIKRGALDHLLEGTGFTREKLEKLDVDSLKPLDQEMSMDEKEKIAPVIKPMEDRTSMERLLPTKQERESILKNRSLDYLDNSDKRDMDRLLPRRREDDRLLPTRSDDRLFPERRSDDRLLPERRLDDRLLRERRSEDHLLTDRRLDDRLATRHYPDDRLGSDRLRLTESDYLRRPLDRSLYDDPYYRRRGIPVDDPYYRRYPDRDYHRPPPSDEVKIKPVVVMDYAHSNSPKEEIRLGLTEEERAFMKRKTDGPKTDEELFHEFLKWKKTKRVPDFEPERQETVTSENYQISKAAPPVPTMSMQQHPMDLPSYTSSSHSTSKTGKSVTPAATVQPVSTTPDIPPQVQELMSTLSKSMIHTEDEAAMALQVSNALTQALLQYQMKNISKELQDTVQQQQQALSKIQHTTGKAETKKLKKQRFDAYSMIDGQTKKAVTSQKVTSSKSSVSNTHTQSVANSSTTQISPQSVQKSQTVSSAQNVMMHNLGYYQQPQGVMTSSQYGVPQTFASAQQMMMTPQTMMSSSQYVVPQTSVTSAQNVMTSQPFAGYQYQQYQNAYSYPQVSQDTSANLPECVPPPMGWNSLYVNQPMAQPVRPPLPIENQFVMPQPPLPTEPPEMNPPPPPPPI